MFQIFNFNFTSLNKKENASKFTIIGSILLILGVLSFFNKTIGIKLISWALGIILLFIAYLNLKNINELKRYASKEEIAPHQRMQIFLLVGVVLLFLFPQKIQGFISSIFGIYLVTNQLIKIVNSKSNPYYRFGFWNIVEFIIGLTLIVSPLFLSRFIASILSVVIISIGLYLISTGSRLKNF